MSLFGSLFKLAGGFLTGGPAGAIAAGTSILLKGRGGPKAGGGISAADSVITTRERFTTPFTSHTTETEKFYMGGGGAGPYGGTPIPGVMPVMTATGCPTGFRLNKSTYVTRGGGTSHWPMTLQVHPKQSTCVKRSRVKGFVKLARKAHSLVGGHRMKQKRIGPGAIEVVRTG